MECLLTLVAILAVAEAPSPRASLAGPPPVTLLENYVKNHLQVFNCSDLDPVVDSPLWNACKGNAPEFPRFPDSQEDVSALFCMAYLDMATRWCSRSDLNNTRKALEAVTSKQCSEPFCPLRREALPFDTTAPETYTSVLYEFLSNGTHCTRECLDYKNQPIEPCLTIVCGNLYINAKAAPAVISAEQRRVNANKAKKIKSNKSDNVTKPTEDSLDAPPSKDKIEQIQKSNTKIIPPKASEQVKDVLDQDLSKVHDEKQIQPNLPKPAPKKEEIQIKIEPPIAVKEPQEPVLPTKNAEKMDTSADEYDPDDQGEKEEMSQDLTNTATKKPYISGEEPVADKEKSEKLPTDEEGYQIGTFDKNQPQDSNFFIYFIFATVTLILGYVIFHNKNKFLGLLVEGRKGSSTTRRRGGGAAYRKLDCTLEEAVSSTPPSHGPHIVY